MSRELPDSFVQLTVQNLGSESKHKTFSADYLQLLSAFNRALPSHLSCATSPVLLQTYLDKSVNRISV